MSPNPLHRIPSLNELLENPRLKAMTERFRPGEVVSTVRIVLDELATEAHHAATERSLPSISELAERISRRVQETHSSLPTRAINATGIILHPELGSPPWPDSVMDAFKETVSGYTIQPLGSSPTATEETRVRDRLRELTGAEDALVFPNAASATIAVLAELSGGRETVVARGQVIQRHNGYQLPKLADAASATLREVGMANCAGADDYRQAICEQTGALLMVHRHTHDADSDVPETLLPELIALGREHSLPVVHDLGPASLIDLEPAGLDFAPLVSKSIEAGTDLALFGHELLGGPVCGIVAGRRALLEKIEGHARARAALLEGPLLAALRATLGLMDSVDGCRVRSPLLRLVTTSADNLKNRAERLAPQIAAAPVVEHASVVEAPGMLLGPPHTVGEMAGWAIAIRPAKVGVGRLADLLRAGVPAVVGQEQGERLLLNLRSVLAGDDIELVERIEQVEA